MLAIVIVAAAAVAFVWPGEKEPEYEGRKLSEYVLMLQFKRPVKLRGVDMWSPEAAEEAGKAMGTNALPWLVRWMAYEPSALTVRSAMLAREWRMRKPAEFLSRKAGLGCFSGEFFGCLGSNAYPAVPQVSRLARDAPGPYRADAAIGALANSGEPGLRALLEILGDEHAPWRPKVAAAIAGMNKTNLDLGSVLPALLLQDCKTRRAAAGSTFGDPYFFVRHFVNDWGRVLPHLTNCAHHVDARVREEVALVLGSLTLDRAQTLGTLMILLKDPDERVRAAAADSIRGIAPEMLTNGVSGP